MSDTATPDTTAKAAQGGTTAYVILMYVEDSGDAEGAWAHMATRRASSAHAAIRGYGGEGRFVAIPARSWKPVQVTAKVETTLELKPAS